MYISCVAYDDKNHVVKITTDGVPAGTYGDYTVADVAATWGVNQAPGFPTNVASTLSSGTYSNSFITKTFQEHTPTVTLDANQVFN